MIPFGSDIERRFQVGKEISEAQKSLGRIRQHGVFGNANRGPFFIVDESLPPVDRDAVRQLREKIDKLEWSMDHPSPLDHLHR